MAIITLNNRSINRSDTASAGQVWTATSATAADFQSGGDLVLLATVDSTSSVANATISLDYSDYTNFLLICNHIDGASTSSGENLDATFKRAGESSFDTASADYGWGGSLFDTGTDYNQNTANTMEIYRAGIPTAEYSTSLLSVPNTSTSAS